jgi:hypothetical protein
VLAAPDRHAARDLEHRAVDVARLVAGQEGVDVGDLLGLRQAPERHLGAHLLQHLVGHGRENGRLDEARGDRVHAHALGPELARPGLGEADDAELRGRIVRLPEVAVDADDAAGVEDHARALRDQGIDHGLGTMEDPAQVDVDDGVELLQRHLLQPRVLGDAGVVDEHVDTAELGLHRGDHGVDLGAVGDVDDEAQRPHAHGVAGGNRGVDALAPHVAGDDDRALARELQRRGQADALGGTGDDADLVLQSHGVVAVEASGEGSSPRKPSRAGR